MTHVEYRLICYFSPFYTYYFCNLWEPLSSNLAIQFVRFVVTWCGVQVFFDMLLYGIHKKRSTECHCRLDSPGLLFTRSLVQISARRPAIPIAVLLGLFTRFRQLLWYYVRLGHGLFVPHFSQLIIQLKNNDCLLECNVMQSARFNHLSYQQFINSTAEGVIK
jgi:hypothetical protein